MRFNRPVKKTPTGGKLDQILSDVKKTQEARQAGYRDKALKLFPHVCARCGQEFTGKKLIDLTVHHKDHNHENNPGDGSNWELLCVRCHEKEHARDLENNEVFVDDDEYSAGLKHDPFADLASLLKKDKP